MVPVAMMAGPAGVGKDTVAGMLQELGGVTLIAQADPLKRFGKVIFGFTNQQLWGPSEMRNAEDLRPKEKGEEFWEELWERFDPQGHRVGTHYKRSELSDDVFNWLQDVGLKDGGDKDALASWFYHEVNYAKQNGLTPRHVLQTLGTEFGRARDPEVWVDYAQNMALKLLATNSTYQADQGPAPRASGVTRLVVITDGRFPNEILATLKTGGSPVLIDGPGAGSTLKGAAATHASELGLQGVPQSWYRFVVWNDKSRGMAPLRQQVDMLAKGLMPMPVTITPYETIAS